MLSLLLSASARAEDDVETLMKSIQPSAEELAWKRIPWRTSFREAVAEAQRAERPVLLWAMDGHPMACT